MECLNFSFTSKPGAFADNRPFAISGVVASGNLEVLMEKAPAPAVVSFELKTSAGGFGETWRAVLGDLAASYPMGGIAVSINDGGAVPTVVSLRIRQALEKALS